jgi:hypothetical protein
MKLVSVIMAETSRGIFKKKQKNRTWRPKRLILYGMETVTLTARRRRAPDLSVEGVVFRNADHGVLRVVRVDGKPVGAEDWDVAVICVKASLAEVDFLRTCEVELESQGLVEAGA